MFVPDLEYVHLLNSVLFDINIGIFKIWSFEDSNFWKEGRITSTFIISTWYEPQSEQHNVFGRNFFNATHINVFMLAPGNLFLTKATKLLNVFWQRFFTPALFRPLAPPSPLFHTKRKAGDRLANFSLNYRKWLNYQHLKHCKLWQGRN